MVRSGFQFKMWSVGSQSSVEDTFLVNIGCVSPCHWPVIINVCGWCTCCTWCVPRCFDTSAISQTTTWLDYQVINNILQERIVFNCYWSLLDQLRDLAGPAVMKLLNQSDQFCVDWFSHLTACSLSMVVLRTLVPLLSPSPIQVVGNFFIGVAGLLRK